MGICTELFSSWDIFGVAGDLTQFCHDVHVALIWFVIIAAIVIGLVAAYWIFYTFPDAAIAWRMLLGGHERRTRALEVAQSMCFKQVKDVSGLAATVHLVRVLMEHKSAPYQVVLSQLGDNALIFIVHFAFRTGSTAYDELFNDLTNARQMLSEHRAKMKDWRANNGATAQKEAQANSATDFSLCHYREDAFGHRLLVGGIDTRPIDALCAELTETDLAAMYGWAHNEDFTMAYAMTASFHRQQKFSSGTHVFRTPDANDRIKRRLNVTVVRGACGLHGVVISTGTSADVGVVVG